MKRLILILLSALMALSAFSAESMIQGKPKYSNINDWLAFGQKHLRRAYRSGGCGPYAFDCSGFTMYMFKELGISLPHNSGDQSKYGEKVSQKKAERGDLVFYAGSKGSSIGHVGIIYEVNSDDTFTFIHASTSQGVIIDSSELPYYKSRFKGIRRVVTDEQLANALGIKKEKKNHKEEKEQKEKEQKKKEKEKEQTNEEAKEPVKTPEQEPNFDDVPDTPKVDTDADYPKDLVSKIKSKRKDKKSRKEAEKKKSSKKKPQQKTKPEADKKESQAKKEVIKKEDPKKETNATTGDKIQADQIHTVAKGETLYSISRKYGVSVADIQSWNGLKDNTISAGQNLIIKTK